MKLILTILTLILCLNSYCQKMNDKSLTTDNKIFELNQKQPGESQFLIIKDLKNNVLKKVGLAKEYDPYSFMTMCTGKSQIAIIGGRYKFFILNCSSNNIFGPFWAEQRELGQDAQSGVFYAYKLIENNKYLLANALDFGLSCYNIEDLNNIKTIQFFKPDSIFYKGKYHFLDSEKNNEYCMISASCGNYSTNIESDILFKNIKLQQDKNQKVKKRIVRERYLILNQISEDSTNSELIVDLESGILLSTQKDNELIKKILKE
ncbi:hypothetical protein SAMN05444274_1268 [Mariniphaga anaerophila]|uniref:Uncharacterized protein n=1 Tax=Mariniphaga anaerophila TaxID=1484053 RepID=A0A1M5GLU1_9BACT|nr:hypothetical protein [Mariniphaga anaerophila]SHG04699.1 hypothetical protein SAMN05444274_1268 [Mariniphaga anaerophila]